jgi:hypothetical protein
VASFGKPPFSTSPLYLYYTRKPDCQKRPRPLTGRTSRWDQRHAGFPDFRIIVRWDKEVQKLREFVEGMKIPQGSCPYHLGYYAALRKVQIISLQHVECELTQGGERCRRVEELLPPSERRDVVGTPPRRQAAESDDSF